MLCDVEPILGNAEVKRASRTGAMEVSKIRGPKRVVYDLAFDPTEFDQIEQTHRIVELISFVPTSTVAIFYVAFLCKQSLIPHCFKIIFAHISIAILGSFLFRLLNSKISLYFLLMRQFFSFMFLAVVIVASLAYSWRVRCLINGQRISLMWFRVVSVLSIWLLTLSLTIPTLLGFSIDYSIVHFVRMLILFPVMLILRIELKRRRHVYYEKTERGNLDQRLQFSTLIHASRQIEIISNCVCVFTLLIFSTTWIQTIYIVTYCDVHLFRYFGIASNCLTNLQFFVLPTWLCFQFARRLTGTSVKPINVLGDELVLRQSSVDHFKQLQAYWN